MLYCDTHIMTRHKRDCSNAILIYFHQNLSQCPTKFSIGNQHCKTRARILKKRLRLINPYLVVSEVSFIADFAMNLLFHKQDQRFMQFNLRKHADANISKISCKFRKHMLPLFKAKDDFRFVYQSYVGPQIFFLSYLCFSTVYSHKFFSVFETNSEC